MKNYIKYTILTLVAALASVGCAHFDEMSKNPYAIYDTHAEEFVQPILYSTQKRMAECEFYWIGELMQYTVNKNFETSAQLVYNYVISENFTRYMWDLYTQFGNAQYMLDTARKESAVEGGNPALVGVALILRSWIGHQIADTYGDVPYSKAGLIGLQGDDFEYTVPYDSQKDIYIDLLRSLEEANACFEEAEALVASGTITSANFNSICDYMYNGNVDQWRRFGNSLYLRLLMRVANKAVEESGGILSLGDEYGDINVITKINEIYESYSSGSGNYPVMRSLDDSARVKFSSNDSARYTPFYSTTGGNWKSQVGCETIKNLMLIDYDAWVGGNVRKYDKEKELDGTWDPRYFRYFARHGCAPTQLAREEMQVWFDTAGYISYYPSGTESYGHHGDLKMDCSYSILNYDELLFIFAEAGARGWLPLSSKASKDLYIEANLQNILQWNVGYETRKDYYTASSPEVVKWLEYLNSEFNYDKAVETIMRQKYVATFWVGIESWADYRRTGYPVLKTNGKAAQNKGILPTRLRYPSTEEFQNAKWYNEAVNGWLKGDNNMTTDVWWADTAESKAIRLLGRQ